MNCEQIENLSLLRRLLDGRLARSDAQEVQRHVAGCTHCRESLRLTAALMMQDPIPAQVRVSEREVAPATASWWARARGWMFPQGVGYWQPALAFAAVLIVATPMLRTLWMPTDPDGAQNTVWRSGDGEDATARSLEAQLKVALGALAAGESRQAFDLLGPQKVDWNRGRLENVCVAYRARARAAADLGWEDAALQDLRRAMSYAELDPDRVACIKQDMDAVQGDGAFCPLPSPDEIH